MALSTFPNRDEPFFLPLIEGKQIRFYVNLDNPIPSAVDIANVQMDLITCDDTPSVVIADVVTLSKNNVNDNGDFHVYGSWTIPATLNHDESYRFAIFNSSTDELYFISNSMRVRQEGYHVKLEYKDTGDIFEYYYSNMPAEFINTYWLSINISKPEPSEEAEGYDKIDNSFETVRSTFRKQREFITEWFDDERHDAFVAAIRHQTLIIDNRKYEKASDQGYQPDWNQNYPLSEGTVKLDDLEFSETYRIC